VDLVPGIHYQYLITVPVQVFVFLSSPFAAISIKHEFDPRGQQLKSISKFAMLQEVT